MKVDDYIFNQPEQQKKILLFLNELLTNQGLNSKIRYAIPFYDYYSWICYLNPIKNDGIELAFLKGNELHDEAGLLKSKGRKMVKGIEIYTLNDLALHDICVIVQQAILLDEMKKNNK